jgi:4-amino-4-deoxy-L-arabinose transferase-like glycosyltransferase
MGPDTTVRRSALAVVVPWIALAAIVCGAGAVRARLLDVPLERDEGGYAYFGQRMLAGEPPFASGYTIHPPGTPAAYAAALAAFGQTTRGVRFGLIVVNAVTILLVFLLARRLYGASGAVSAAAAQAALSMSPDLLGPFAHANHFVVLFAVAGLWAFAEGFACRRLAWFAAAGLLLGLAPIMKQPGAVFPAFALCWLLWSRLRERPLATRFLVREVVVLAGTSLVGPLVTGALLAAAGVLPQAWRWLFTYAGAYAGMQSLAEGMRLLGSRLSQIGPPSLGFAVLAVAGLLLRGGEGWGRTSPAGRLFAGALLAFSFAAVCPGLYFRHHYFLLMVPAVALLVGRAVACVVRNGPLPALAGFAALGISCAQGVLAHRELLFTMTPVEIARKLYGANPFPESVEVARYLEANGRPDDRIAILGSEPQILFYAHRRSATGYLYLYPLVEPNPLGPAMREELIQEVEAARPAFVVWVNIPASWDTRVRAAQRVVTWADAYLSSGYDLVGRVAIRGPRQTDYAWDAEAARLGPQGGNLLVFRRRGP